jgi:hypothetical protein
LLKIQEIDKEIRKKYSDDMVENLAESPGMCSDGPGSALIKIPKRELFSLREGKKKEKGKNWLRWRKERRGWIDFIPRPGTHPRATRAQSATPPRTVREARGRSGPQARTIRYCFQNDQSCTFAPRATRTVRAASRTVRPVAADSPNSSFKFSVK